MGDSDSIVTQERFSSGLRYKEYVAQMNVNHDKFQQAYDSFRLTTDDTEFFSNAVRNSNGPRKMLVLGEDWCPDVYRGMPIMARISEASGIDMRVFPRDQNLDIMDAFLQNGEFRSIPVAVFYTDELEYIGHWIERSTQATTERSQIQEAVKEEMPDADEQAIRAETRARTQAKTSSWEQASVKEMRALIETWLSTR